MATKMNPAIVTPVNGINTQQVDRIATLPTNDQGTTIYPFNLGMTVCDEDIGISVYAKAGGGIPGGTSNVSITGGQGTLTATAGGGNFVSPVIIMTTGDAGWFSKIE